MFIGPTPWVHVLVTWRSVALGLRFWKNRRGRARSPLEVKPSRIRILTLSLVKIGAKKPRILTQISEWILTDFRGFFRSHDWIAGLKNRERGRPALRHGDKQVNAGRDARAPYWSHGSFLTKRGSSRSMALRLSKAHSQTTRTFQT